MAVMERPWSLSAEQCSLHSSAAGGRMAESWFTSRDGDRSTLWRNSGISRTLRTSDLWSAVDGNQRIGVGRRFLLGRVEEGQQHGRQVLTHLLGAEVGV